MIDGSRVRPATDAAVRLAAAPGGAASGSFDIVADRPFARFAVTPPAERWLAACVVLIVHVALLAIVLRETGGDVGAPPAGYGHGIHLFDMRGDGAAARPVAPPRPVRTVAKAVRVMAPPVVADGADASGGAIGLDPFAAASFIARDAAVVPADGEEARRIRSTLHGLDPVAAAQVLSEFRNRRAATSGIAMIAVRVRPDGTVESAQFLGGSVGDAEGAALAALFERRILFAPAPGTETRSAVLGPIALTVAEPA